MTRLAKSLFVLVLLMITTAGNSQAASPETFEEAQRLSAEQGLPLLIEFIRDD